MLFKYTLVFSALIMLQACGVEPEGTDSSFKLASTDGTTTAQAETKTLPTAGEPSTFTASEPSKESTAVSETQTVRVRNVPATEPASPARSIFLATGVDFWLVEENSQSMISCREQDQLVCEAALEEAKAVKPGHPWVLSFRPNEEILTENGFVSPPPSVESILAARDVTSYELVDGQLTVFEAQENSAASAIDVLKVFYPDINWTLVTKPNPPPSIESILTLYAVNEYQLNNGVLSVSLEYESQARGAIFMLERYYPETTWTLQLPMPEEPVNPS